jgi:ABC-type bacteriocin/lantibiotic exporter with double-glycine peptidase domain
VLRREMAGELNTRATDVVAGLRILRGIGGERVFGSHYREESQRVRSAGVETARVESLLNGTQTVLPGLLIALVTSLGAHLAVDGRISLGRLIAFYGYAVFLIGPVRTLSTVASGLIRAHVAAGRITRVLALEPEFPDSGTITPSAPASLVDPVSGLRLRHGLFTAIVTAEPGVAAAIADRLGGYAAGPVTYGGIPLAQVADLRARILVGINDDRLFSGNLAQSLGIGSARGMDPRVALHAACVEDLVDEAGPMAEMVEAGREFSGGQQQRLRLARALLANPEVLILVEPTNAVDAHTEARIAERLVKARLGRTTAVFTASPLVLNQADHVAFIDDGQVVAEGVHGDLLRDCSPYAAALSRE